MPPFAASDGPGEFNDTTTEQTRVWNTLLRFDQQINASHTWAVRWLREYSPQFNQIIGNVTLGASREEDDTDQTLVGSLTSVFGNTKVNTLRLAFTREDVAFANPQYNGNGRRQDLLEPTLNFLTFTDQQNATAQARINNAYQIDDTFAWFLPGRRGDHDLKLGLQYQFSTNDFTNDGNLNGTFTFPGNGPFNASDPRTYPDRFPIRVPGSQAYYMRAHFFSAFLQDKWRINRNFTLSLGLRYDLEAIPLRELDNPEFSNPDDYPVDKNNFSPRIGFSYAFGDTGRTVLRGGYGMFFDKTHFELITAIITGGVFSDSFTAVFPANSADPGPSKGVLPTDPFLVSGPTVNRNLLNQLYPPGTLTKNTGDVFFDSPDRRIPATHQTTVGFEHQPWSNISMGVDYIHGFGRDLFMTKGLNPGLRVNTSRTGQIVRINPAFVRSVFQRINVGKTDYDALQFQFEKRFSHNFSSRFGYTLSYSRGNTSGSGIPTSSFQLLDDMRLDLNQGPTDFDRRHNFVWSGMAEIPRTRGLTFSWVARALSGLPFTVQDTNVDPDRNGILFDPLPAGTYSGQGTDGFEVESDGGRNGARGPGFWQWDIRFGYRLRPREGMTLDVFAEVFNLFNRANFDSPTGDRRSTNFLVLTGLRAGAIPTT
ncbi:MAG: TonB-dependent receptor, partial [Acidobacteriota bacterium]